MTFPFATDQTIAAFVVTAAAVIDIAKRIGCDIRTMRLSGTGHTRIVFADQIVGTSVLTATAAINRSHRDFASTAIGLAISEFTCASVADQAVITAMIASAAVFQIGERVAKHTIANRIAKTTTAGALLASGAGAGVFTAVLSAIRLAPILI